MAKKTILVILLFFTWGFIFNSANAEETNNWNSESMQKIRPGAGFLGLESEIWINKNGENHS